MKCLNTRTPRDFGRGDAAWSINNCILKGWRVSAQSRDLNLGFGPSIQRTVTLPGANSSRSSSNRIKWPTEGLSSPRFTIFANLPINEFTRPGTFCVPSRRCFSALFLAIRPSPRVASTPGIIQFSNIHWPESFTGTALLQTSSLEKQRTTDHAALGCTWLFQPLWRRPLRPVRCKQTRRATFAGCAADSEHGALHRLIRSDQRRFGLSAGTGAESMSGSPTAYSWTLSRSEPRGLKGLVVSSR